MPSRRTSAEDRRATILEAALDEFIAKGFANARVEDIARRAGIAKGTIYLNFKDKEALFEALIETEILPTVQTVATKAPETKDIRGLLEATIFPLLADLQTSRKGAVFRLLIAESARFPHLAELYFRKVIEPGLQAFSNLARKAYESGEMSNPDVAEYPQLFIAPAILALIWSNLFQSFQPLDAQGLMKTHFDILFREPTPPE